MSAFTSTSAVARGGSRLRPSMTEVADLAFGGALLLLAILGFRATFAGGEEVLVGVPAVLLGLLVGIVIARLRLDLITGGAVALGAFVLCSGAVAIRGPAVAGFLPTPDVVRGLVDGLVSGWARLLTTVPPAGEAGNLLAVPYTVGYLGATVTAVLVVRVRRPAVPVLPAVGVLVVAILFGTERPASLLLQGVLFCLVLIAWVSVRVHRHRTSTAGSPPGHRMIAGGAVLAAIGVIGGFVGPHMPGAGANPRFVLREHFIPPFDPLAEPSPLTGFRQYSGEENETTPVLEVRGLPAGTPVRLAALDGYDGLVWRATGAGDATAGRFVRVGERIPGDTTGTPASVSVTVLRPHGVWLPTVGDVTSFRFDDDATDDRLRFNLATNTAAVPGGVPDRIQYTVDTVIPESPDAELQQLPVDRRHRLDPSIEVPPELISIAAELRGSAESPYGKVEAIAERLRTDGAFSDGGPDAAVTTPPGHSLSRLARFLGAPQWVGNEEQYAAVLGLLAWAEGIPARVVMGYLPEPGAGDRVTITGADVTAWVEIPLDGAGWVPIDPTPPEDNVPDPSVKPRPRELNPEPQPPPPPPLPPPASLPQDLEATDTEPDEEPEPESEGQAVRLFAAAGGALALATTPLLLILLLKHRRRRRRRNRGSTVERANGGWEEILDWATDLGRPIPPRTTRTEASGAVGAPSAVGLAASTDAATFGASEPAPEDVDRLWAEVDAVLDELRGQHSRRDRWRAAVTPTSLRRRSRGRGELSPSTGRRRRTTLFSTGTSG